jgi:hypothetical protein
LVNIFISINLEGFFFDKRKEIFCSSYEYDSKNKILYIIHKPYLNEEIYNKLLKVKDSKKKGRIVDLNETYYFLFSYRVQKFEYLDNNKCLYTTTYFINSGKILFNY